MSDVELTGSRAALLALFVPNWVPHGMKCRLPRAKRKEARQARLHNFAFALRRGFAEAALERPRGPKARNARKQERRAAR